MIWLIDDLDGICPIKGNLSCDNNFLHIKLDLDGEEVNLAIDKHEVSDILFEDDLK